MTDSKVYKRGALKGRLKKEYFEKKLEDYKVDKISSSMGGVYFVGKFKQVITDAMEHTDTAALTKEMFEKSADLFLKKVILDLEESLRSSMVDTKEHFRKEVDNG